MPGPALWEVGGPFPGTGPPRRVRLKRDPAGPPGGCPHRSSSSLEGLPPSCFLLSSPPPFPSKGLFWLVKLQFLLKFLHFHFSGSSGGWARSLPAGPLLWFHSSYF